MEDLPKVTLIKEVRRYDPPQVDRTYMAQDLDEEHLRLFRAISDTIDSTGGFLRSLHLFKNPFYSRINHGGKHLRALSFQFVVRSDD